MSILYILLAILLLAILIVIHEMGHFWAARWMKIDIMEFSVGFGPKLLGWKSRKYDTTFAIRAIPLGGYCAFYEEGATLNSDEILEKDDPRIYSRFSVWKRLFVSVMGPVMNFILAFILATGYYWVNGIGTVTGIDPFISGVTAAGPAYEAGLKEGDVITEINGVNMLDGTVDTLTGTIAAWKEGDAPLQVTVQRGEETLHLSMTPLWDEQEKKMRVGVLISGKYRVAYQPANLFGAIGAGAGLCWNAGGLILRSLKALVTTGEGFDQTSGPVGIISTVSNEVRAGGLQAYIELMISISINLGIINLLPIPGLDGSKLLFGLIEAIRRKPIKKEREAMITLIGMGLLLAFILFLTFRDVMNLFR